MNGERDSLCFVGRHAETAALGNALTRAVAGAGSLWLVTGDPGIGKSRLTERLGEHAQGQGFVVLVGRCWEAGGAPPFWPFTQALRALWRQLPEAALLRLLADKGEYLRSILPEIDRRVSGLPKTPTLEPEQARFRQLDAVATLLCDAAQEAPLLLILEDLHSADAASVTLLELLLPYLRSSRLVVLGTYRETEADAHAIGPTLSRIAAQGRAVTLTPLGRDEVRGYIEQAAGIPVSERVVDGVLRATEGNPLFVVELVRLLVATPEGLEPIENTDRLPIPPTVRHTIGQRLARLPREVQLLLRQAAIAGREVRTSDLAHLAARDPEQLQGALRSATEASVLVEVERGRFRFTHVLLREVLYKELESPVREALHLRLANALSAEGASPASELAHHLALAGPPARERAIQALLVEAHYACQQYAFEAAEAALMRALGFAQTQPHARSLQAQILVELGRARILAGKLALGQATCRDALALAREAGAPELMARAALEYGSMLVYAVVDHQLVRFLQEALEALGSGDNVFKARVLARLAAALQPAEDPEGPMALARAAIDMARRLGDRHALLDAIRTGCSALMDIAPPEERRSLNRELVELAVDLRDVPAEMRGHMRLAFDCYELADLAGANAAIDACSRLAQRLDLPHFKWKALAFEAMRLTWSGQFDDAEQIAAEAEQLGRQVQDPNAARSLLAQRIQRLRLQGRWEEMEALLPSLEAVFAGTPVGEQIARVLAQGERVRAGRRYELSQKDHEAMAAMLRFGDCTLRAALATVARAAGLRDISQALIALCDPVRHHLASGGMSVMTWEAPVGVSLALAHAALGQRREALALLDDARRRMIALGSAPHAAWIAVEHLALLTPAERAAPPGAALLAEAAGAARKHAMPGLMERLRSFDSTAPPDQQSPKMLAGVIMMRHGDYWEIDGGSERVRLRDSRGLQMLELLVQSPGQGIHVLELSNPGAAAHIDRGDAGPLIDVQARTEYRERLTALRAELEEAEAWRDLHRADRLREEIEALTGELGRSLGLSGHHRKAGSAAERARSNVQRRLKDAIGKIAAHCPELGRHLDWAVRTGTYCSYRPE